MPWVLKGNCVHKEKPDGSAGEAVKCHKTRKQAEAHMRALYKNVPDAKKGAFVSAKKPTLEYMALKLAAMKTDSVQAASNVMLPPVTAPKVTVSPPPVTAPKVTAPPTNHLVPVPKVDGVPQATQIGPAITDTPPRSPTEGNKPVQPTNPGGPSDPTRTRVGTPTGPTPSGGPPNKPTTPYRPPEGGGPLGGYDPPPPPEGSAGGGGGGLPLPRGPIDPPDPEGDVNIDEALRLGSWKWSDDEYDFAANLMIPAIKAANSWKWSTDIDQAMAGLLGSWKWSGQGHPQEELAIAFRHGLSWDGHLYQFDNSDVLADGLVRGWNWGLVANPHLPSANWRWAVEPGDTPLV